MERFINFRAFLFIFIGAIVGVVFCFQSLLNNLALFIITAILILGLVAFVVFTKVYDKNKKFAFVNKFILCFLIGFIFYTGLSCVNFFSFNNKLPELENAQVFARVCSVSEKNNYTYLILEDLEIASLDTNNIQKVNGNFSLTVSYEDYLKITIGDKVRFKTSLTKNNLIENDKFNNYLYKNDIKYTAFINSEDIYVTSGGLKLDEKIQFKVKEILLNNLSYNNASIAYASIFGDKTLLDQDIYNAFSVSGTAHLLCVSGFHVGFLVSLLYLFFKLLKIKRKYIFVILLVLLPFYCYLCGFSPSVVRASIMSLVLCGANTFGHRYDSLSALSFAGCIILLFNPFYIFDIGFQLSFASCFGIILLTPTFNKFFEKINFSNKFSQTFSITLSASLGTFPIILHNFEKMSFLSICANIIVVPLFSILFSLLIIFVLINTILPFGFLFYVIELGFNFITLITKGFGAVTSMIFVTNSFAILYSFIFYLFVIFISKFINLKIKLRILFMCILAILFSFSFLLQYFPQNFNQNYLLNMSVENSTIITNSKNVKVMVGVNDGTKEDLSLIKKDLFSFKIINLDILILADYNEEMQTTVATICNDYNVKILYLPHIEQNAEKYLFKNLNGTKIYQTNNEFCFYDNFSFKIISEINSVYLNAMDEERSLTMLVAKNLNKTTATYLIRENLRANIVKFNFVNKKYIESVKNFDTIYCEDTSSRQSNIFTLNNLPKLIKVL